MEKKWKVLLISIVVYQFILTAMILKLDQYAQWLHFNTSGFPNKWYQGPATAPMREAMIWLGVSMVALIVINVVQFRKSSKKQ